MRSSHMPTHPKAWRICCLVAVLLVALTFTPLVLIPDEIEPTLLWMPRTLWLGMLISLGFFLLTLWGAFLLTRQNGSD
jgi:hypothetical protein